MADNTPIDTGEKTVTGRTIWRDPTTGQDYSERSTTFEIDGKYYTMPTVAEDGTQYTDRQIMDYVKEYGPSDYLTGEELPEFRYREDALQYAVSRSDTRKQKKALGMEKGGILTQTGSNNYGLPIDRDEEALSRGEETNSKKNQLLELQNQLSFMKKDRLKNKKYKFFSKEDADGNAIPYIMFKSDEEMSMDDVKRIFEENNSGPEPVPRALTAKKVNDYLEKANPTKREFINYFSSVELNKGGIPMKRQMEMFNEGGLSQEGGMVDEVSGNEVPMGSTREEVRDDIPAQVSEGEFIFPADVTRFIGLDKLMQLRQEAKMGLKKMDAMGQMGNSEEATMPDDMPFNMSDLMGAEAIVIEGRKKDDDEAAAIVAMAQGGVIYAQAGTSVPTTRSLAPVEQKPDYGAVSFNEVMGDGLQQTKVYVNKDGEKINVMFVGDNPLYPIPDGYTLFDPTAETTEDAATEIEDVVAAVTEKVRRISDRTPMKKTPFQEAGGWGMDFKTNGVVDPAKVKLWTNEYAKTSGNATAALTGVATVLGGPLGILVYLAGKGNAKSAAANYDDAMKAAQQTNVAGQVDALKKINSTIKEGGDKTLLGKIVDKLKTTLGFTDEQAEKVKTVSSETPEQRAARLAAEKAAAAAQGNDNVDAGLTPEALPYDPKAPLSGSNTELNFTNIKNLPDPRASAIETVTANADDEAAAARIAAAAGTPNPRTGYGGAAAVPTDLRPPSVIASDEADAKAAARIAATDVNQQGDLEKTTIPDAYDTLQNDEKDRLLGQYRRARMSNPTQANLPGRQSVSEFVEGVAKRYGPDVAREMVSEVRPDYTFGASPPGTAFGDPGFIPFSTGKIEGDSLDSERLLDPSLYLSEPGTGVSMAEQMARRKELASNISTQQKIEEAGAEIGATPEAVDGAIAALQKQTADDLEQASTEPAALATPITGDAGYSGYSQKDFLKEAGVDMRSGFLNEEEIAANNNLLLDNIANSGRGFGALSQADFLREAGVKRSNTVVTPPKDDNKKKSSYSQRLRKKREKEQKQKVSSARARSKGIAARAKDLEDLGIDLGGKTALQTVALQAEKNTIPTVAPDEDDPRKGKYSSGGLASRKKKK